MSIVSLLINIYRAFTIDFTKSLNTGVSQIPAYGFSQTLFDPQGQYAFWGNNIGYTVIDGNQCAVFLGASGFMQMDGYFSAAEIETLGSGIFATISVNGIPSWSQNAGQTGVVKKTIFTDAGPGWNSFNIGAGASLGLLGLQRINLYQRSRDFGVSFGALVDFDLAQTFTNRDAINASLMALGGVRRIYADQIYFKNTWLRGQTWTVPGGAYYQGASTNGSFSFQYYGTHYGIVGTLNAGSTLTLDGVGVTSTVNVMQSVATLGFHTIAYTGGTAIISAIDYVNPVYRSRVDATIAPIPIAAQQASVSPPIITDWAIDSTITLSSSFGTITNSKIFSRRVGDSKEVRGSVTTGTNQASIGSIILSAGTMLDTSKLAPTAVQPLGIGYNIPVTATFNIWSNNAAFVLFFDGSTNNQIFITPQTDTSIFVKFNANSLISTGQPFGFMFTIPILGWSANGL